MPPLRDAIPTKKCNIFIKFLKGEIVAKWKPCSLWKCGRKGGGGIAHPKKDRFLGFFPFFPLKHIPPLARFVDLFTYFFEIHGHNNEKTALAWNYFPRVRPLQLYIPARSRSWPTYLQLPSFESWNKKYDRLRPLKKCRPPRARGTGPPCSGRLLQK